MADTYTPDQIAAAKAAKISDLDLVTAREYLKILKDIADTDEQKAKLQERINELEARSLAHIKDRLKELEKEKILLESTKNLYEDRNNLSRQAKELRDNELKTLENLANLAKDGKQQDKDNLENAIQKYDYLVKNLDLSRSGLTLEEQKEARARILLGLLAEQNNSLDKVNQQTKASLSATTGVSDNWKNTLVGSLIQGGDKGIKEAGIAFKDTFSSANIAGSLLMKVQESTIMMVKMADTTFATFNKTIGTTGELNDEIYDLSRNNTLLGFTLEETSQAYTALAGGFVDFRGMSKENRQELGQTVTELQAIGISADVATKNITFFSKAMGLSREEIQSLSKELVAVAGALEMAPSKIASDFAAAASTLVVYGNRGIEVFKGLEAASKASSVEISNLISIASKMDTFQGAAEVAGRLNSILGGGLLNSSQLLMATEEERIRLIVESVQMGGVQFDDLTKQEQQAIANAAGITDMAEANKLFGMSLDVYDDYVAKTALSSEEQANLEERIQASKSAQEKFNYIMQAFAVLVMPILDGLTGLVDGFMKLNDRMDGTLPTILASIFGLKSFVSNFPAIMKFLGQIYGNLAPIGRFFLSIGRWFMSAGPYLIRFGTFITGLLPSMATLAAIGTKIGGVFTAIVQGIGTALTAVGTAMGVTVGWVIAAIAAILGIFYIIYEVFFNTDRWFTDMWKKWRTLDEIDWLIGKFNDLKNAINNFMKAANLRNSPSFQEMADHLAAGFTKFANVITSLAVPALNMFLAPLRIVGSIMSSVWSGISTIVGATSSHLAAGFTKFANVITSLAIPALNMLMAPLRLIGSIMSGVWSGISTIIGATSSLFGKENVVGIKANFDATEALATTAAKITPDSMTNVKQLAAEVQKFNMELKTMTTIAASEPLDKLAKAIAGQANSIADSAQTLILKVGDIEIGRVIGNFLNRKGNIDTAVKSTSTVT